MPSAQAPPLLCRPCLAPPLACKPGHARDAGHWRGSVRAQAGREGRGRGGACPLRGRAGWNATWAVEEEWGAALLILDRAWEWLGSETGTCTHTRTGPWHGNPGSGG
ncbi:hypothetical protein EI94DRAFT_1706066 [Lactarius quietus]|nr:hypothetical protein EI94DRAFT_1706066 [Lactarius quietus]